MKTKLLENINHLTNDELIILSVEMSSPIVPENSLIRRVIKNTEIDTPIPMLAFIAVGHTLAIVLAERLIKAEKTIDDLIHLKSKK